MCAPVAEPATGIPSKCNERNSHAAQISHQRLTFPAVGTHGYVHRVAMIKPELIVNRRLTISADRHRVMKLRKQNNVLGGTATDEAGPLYRINAAVA